jgi:1-acyl-sn-glycerol-3-phosphate acyltransferase
MKIYNMTVEYRYVNGIRIPVNQPIDLDYIVSVGPVSSLEYSGASFGNPYAYFDIYIKIGEPIRIKIYSGKMQDVPQEIVEELRKIRELLIETWINKDAPSDNDSVIQVL